jgi:hypothetical protein
MREKALSRDTKASRSIDIAEAVGHALTTVQKGTTAAYIGGGGEIEELEHRTNTTLTEENDQRAAYFTTWRPGVQGVDEIAQPRGVNARGRTIATDIRKKPIVVAFSPPSLSSHARQSTIHLLVLSGYKFSAHTFLLESVILSIRLLLYFLP